MSLKKLFLDEEGATMTEYILLVVLVAVAAIGVVKIFGEKITSLFTDATDKIDDNTADALK